MTDSTHAPRRSIDPSLGFTAKLALVAAPLGGVVLLTHSRTLMIAVGCAAAMAVLLAFPGVTSTRLLGAGLVLTPDAIIVAHLGASPVSLREVALVALYATLALAVVRGRLHLSLPAPLLMGAILLAAILGAIENQRSRSLLEFGVLVLLPPIAGAILGSERDIALDFLRGITAGTILLIIWAFVESLSGHNYLVTSTAIGSFVRTGHVRSNAGWDYPTMLSAFICLAGFLVVEVLHQRWGLIGMIVGCAFVTAGVITTQSRSGLLGLAAGVLAYLVLQRRASQSLKVVVGLIVAVGLLMVLPGAAPGSFRQFVSQSLTRGSSANANVEYRQHLYSDFWTAMAQHPWFGYGYGSGKSVATTQLSSYFGNQTDLASLPVSLGVQLGYVGAGATFLMILWVLLRIARVRSVPARLPLAAGLIACVVAMLAVPVSPPLSWMLLLTGLAWGLERTQRRATHPPLQDGNSNGVGRESAPATATPRAQAPPDDEGTERG